MPKQRGQQMRARLAPKWPKLVGPEGRKEARTRDKPSSSHTHSHPLGPTETETSQAEKKWNEMKSLNPFINFPPFAEQAAKMMIVARVPFWCGFGCGTKRHPKRKQCGPGEPIDNGPAR